MHIATCCGYIKPKDGSSRFSSRRKAAQMAIMQSLNLPNLMPENAPLSALSAVIGRKLAFTRLQAGIRGHRASVSFTVI
jgi:hypothetical protein